MMKNPNRAMRRKHSARLYKKRLKEEIPRTWGHRSTEERDTHLMWAKLRARARVTTNVLCSCGMCCSPRKTYGNGKAGRTFQELRSDDIWGDANEE